MQNHFPMYFKLENGTAVHVNKVTGNTYDFLLTKTDGKTEQFTYTKDDRLKEEVESPLDFNQLDALRTFWVKTEEIL